MENINYDLLAYMILYIIKNTSHSKNTKIQKIIYIYEKEEGKGLFRENFKSYHYGPYSSNVWKIIDILTGNKYISDDQTKYSITQRGQQLLESLEKKSFPILEKPYFKFVCNTFASANSDMIIKYVYNKYKEDLEKSIIIDELIYEEGDYERISIVEKSLRAIKKRLEKSKN